MRERLADLQKRAAAFYASHRKAINASASLIWLALLVIILWAGWRSRAQLLPYLENADWGQAWGVLAAYLLALTFAVGGWALIMHTFDASISWWTHVRIYMATRVASRLPGTVWYIGGRMLLYKRLGVSQISTAAASGIELVTSFLANCLVGAFLLPFGLGLSLYWLIPLGGLTLLGLLILRPATLARVLVWLKRPLPQPIEGWRVAWWLVNRVALTLAGGLMIFQIIRIFVPMNASLLPLVLGGRAISGAASVLTYFLPSSFGAAEITLAAVLSSAIPMSLSAVVAIAARMLTSLFEVLFGGVFYFVLKASPDLKAAASPDAPGPATGKPG